MSGMVPEATSGHTGTIEFAAQARAWARGHDAGLEPLVAPALPLPRASEEPAREPKPPRQKRQRGETRWPVVLIGAFTALMALGLACYAAAASYESVSHLAAAHNVPLPRLNPLGIDGGLLGVIVISLALYWLGMPLRWLRFTGRLFAIGTIAANAAAGWPDPVGVGLRIAAPVLFVVITEAAYAILVHRGDDLDDAIPLARWLLAPVQTFALWRRMKLWRVRSYKSAVEMDLNRRRAIVQLGAHYGRNVWRANAPADLVWMLTHGVHMEDALERVAVLTAPPAPEESAPESLEQTAPDGRARGATSPRRSAPKARRRSPADDLTMEAKALEVLAADLTMSGAKLAERLGCSEGYARKLKKRLAGKERPQERTAPPRQERPGERSKARSRDR